MALGADYATVNIPPLWCGHDRTGDAHTRDAKKSPATTLTLSIEDRLCCSIFAFSFQIKLAGGLPHGPPQSRPFWLFRRLLTDSAQHPRETMEGRSLEMDSPIMVIPVHLGPITH